MMIPFATIGGFEFSTWGAGLFAVLASLWKRRPYQDPYDQLQQKLRRRWASRHPAQAYCRRQPR